MCSMLSSSSICLQLRQKSWLLFYCRKAILRGSDGGQVATCPYDSMRRLRSRRRSSFRMPAAMLAIASHLLWFSSIELITLSAVRLQTVVVSASARYLAYRGQMNSACSASSMLSVPQWSQ